MPQFSMLTAANRGTPIALRNGRLIVPNDPIIPFIEGDGTGPGHLARAACGCSTPRCSEGLRAARAESCWFEVLAGEKAKKLTGEWLPSDTLEAVKAYKVAIKGPLTTPVGGGIRSLNVTLRQVLDLTPACGRSATSRARRRP